jgi:hypothetical protein
VKVLSLVKRSNRFSIPTYAAAGAAVAARWHLPPVLIHVIEHHHDPFASLEQSEESIQRTLAIVHVADVLSDQYEIGRGIEDDTTLIDEAIWSYLGIDFEICRTLSDSVLAEVNEFRRIFDLSGADTSITRSASRQKSLVRAAPTGPTIAAPGMARGIAQSESLLGDFARLAEASKRLALLAGLEELFPNIASEAMTLLGADAAHVFVPEEGKLNVATAAGLTQLRGRHTPLENSLAGFVATTGAAQVITNIDNAPESWEKRFFNAADFRYIYFCR